jgi:GAF domain-containing protein
MSDEEMVSLTRERRLMQTLIRLADTMVDEYDVVDLLQGLAEDCTELLDSTASGILLADSDGHLEVVAASDESVDTVEVLQVAAGAGPCVESYRRGVVVSIHDLQGDEGWPGFAQTALDQGYRSVHAVPLRLRQVTVGSMNLFRSEPGGWSDGEEMTARALADMATIGILQSRAIDEAHELNTQLQRALESRVLIEQAKGFVSYRNNLSMAEAFELIRSRARSERRPLSEIARRIVERKLDV